MLTTEHFALQGSRASTISESTARSTLYMGAVSATLISLGFIGQVSEVGDTFNLFALAVLPTLFVLGIFTFGRVVENSIEDFLYGRAINRIRAYYLEQAGPEARWFMLSAHDDAPGVLANMGLRRSRAQLLLTAAMMVATVNSVVGGSVVALLIGTLGDPPLWIPAGAGVLFAIAAFLVHRHLDEAIHERAEDQTDVLFPTPGP